MALAPAGATGAVTTNVSGTISTNTTWTLANSPYVMTGDVTVAAGVTLTIEPGVLVQGNSSSRTLVVNGSLSAVGTAAQPITFTSTADSAPAQWRGIQFRAGAGASSLKHVQVRRGGYNISSSFGMVEVEGGTITIEDSTFTDSSVSGLKVRSASSDGSGATAVIRRSKFEGNGFVEGGNGLYVFNARVVVEGSAFWSNSVDGIQLWLGSGYVQAPSEVTGSSIWSNDRFGVYINQDPAVPSLAPDGHVAGKPGNAVYDNGAFSFSQTDGWRQLDVARQSLDVDWSGTYWGPVSHVPCSGGTANGHLAYGAPDDTPTLVPYGWSVGP